MRRILGVALLFAVLAGGAAAQSRHQVAVGPLTVPRWADGGPVTIKVVVTNLGKVREDYRAPDSTLRATIPGHGTVDFPDFSVRPGGEETVSAVWEAPPLVCLCHVRVETTNRHGRPITLQQGIVVFPVRVVGGALVAIVGLAVLFRLARTRRKEEPAPAAAAAPAEPEPMPRPLAERTAPPPVERPEPEPAPPPPPEPEPAPEPEPEPVPVPGLAEPPPREAVTVPDAVRDLPRADELPDWFVRLRTGAPLEPEKKRRRAR